MNDYIANLIGSNSQDNGIYADNDQKKKVLEQFFSTYSKLESLSVSSSSVSYETPFLTNAGSILNISAVEYDTNSFAIAYEKGTNTFIQ
jgi:hypothetical protein